MLPKGLYVITDEQLTPNDSVVEQIRTVLQEGVKIIQYRNKSDTDSDVEAICIQLQQLCTIHGATFIIDDRPHLAQKIQADGLHIGKNDISLQEARIIFPKGIIGVSCYGSVRKALEAQNDGASYVAFGSFFHSPTKPHSGIVSMSVLQKAKEALSIPICAIGGINITNIHQISTHGPDMISVVSAVFEGDIKSNITQLTEKMQLLEH
jgi:thiamine-phosphate pyrophosphorylase